MDKRNLLSFHSNTIFQSVVLIVATSFLISSCGPSKTTASNGFTVGAQMVAVEDIDKNQRNIATRICYAYQSKNSNFNSSDYLGTKFTFNVSHKTCSSTSSNITLAATLKKQSAGFIYSANTPINYYQYVQTNTNGYLSQFCTKINSNQAISNTINYNGQTVQINFFHDSLDGYTLNYFTKDNTNTMKIDSAETFRVRTQFDYSPGNILGMDEGYVQQAVCAEDSAKYSEMNQKFISH